MSSSSSLRERAVCCCCCCCTARRKKGFLSADKNIKTPLAPNRTRLWVWNRVRIGLYLFPSLCVFRRPAFTCSQKSVIKLRGASLGCGSQAEPCQRCCVRSTVIRSLANDAFKRFRTDTKHRSLLPFYFSLDSFFKVQPVQWCLHSREKIFSLFFRRKLQIKIINLEFCGAIQSLPLSNVI